MTEPEEPKDVVERFASKKRERLEAGAEYRSYMRWAGKALEVPLGVVVGVAFGVFFERQFGVPHAIWFGLFFGICAAVRSGYRLTKSYAAAFPDDEEPTP